MHIVLDMIPPRSTAQGKGCFVVDGKPVFFTKSKQKADQNFYAALLYPHRPVEPFSKPISLSVEFFFPWRKTEKKSVMAKGWHYHTTKPDADNALKGLMDVMNRLGFFTDDSIVCDLSVLKRYSDKPQVIIDIEELEWLTL